MPADATHVIAAINLPCCLQVYEPTGTCNDTGGNVSHVYGILLGDTFVTHGGALQGSITSQLGQLSDLRYLDLRSLGLTVRLCLHVQLPAPGTGVLKDNSAWLCMPACIIWIHVWP